jgi:hypothetical protein
MQSRSLREDLAPIFDRMLRRHRFGDSPCVFAGKWGNFSYLPVIYSEFSHLKGWIFPLCKRLPEGIPIVVISIWL